MPDFPDLEIAHYKQHVQELTEEIDRLEMELRSANKMMSNMSKTIDKYISEEYKKKQFITEFVLNRSKANVNTRGKFWADEALAAWNVIEKVL